MSCYVPPRSSAAPRSHLSRVSITLQLSIIDATDPGHLRVSSTIVLKSTSRRSDLHSHHCQSERVSCSLSIYSMFTMSQNEGQAQASPPEFDKSAAALASLVRNHLSTLPDWPILETFVEHILFPIDNSIHGTFIHDESRIREEFIKEAKKLAQAVSHQDAMMASLTQELCETRTCSTAVASCMNEVFSHLDAKDIALWQLETQNQCLQVEYFMQSHNQCPGAS